uniref:Uncharacterized protein n=1 Tax=Panagrolaimus sp. JU765 TaxID=591449 RepID=A0AC34RHT3_9BILA
MDNDLCYEQIDKRIKAEVQKSADNKNSTKTPVAVKTQASLKKNIQPKVVPKNTKAGVQNVITTKKPNRQVHVASSPKTPVAQKKMVNVSTPPAKELKAKLKTPVKVKKTNLPINSTQAAVNPQKNKPKHPASSSKTTLKPKVNQKSH